MPIRPVFNSKRVFKELKALAFRATGAVRG
jgi:hypothetical protein